MIRRWRRRILRLGLLGAVLFAVFKRLTGRSAPDNYAVHGISTGERAAPTVGPGVVAPPVVDDPADAVEALVVETVIVETVSVAPEAPKAAPGPKGSRRPFVGGVASESEPDAAAPGAASGGDGVNVENAGGASEIGD